MRAVLLALAGLLGAWLVVAPWVLGYSATSARSADPALGLAAIVLAVIGVRWPGVRVAAWLITAGGLVLLVAGLSGAFGDQAARVDEGLAGLFLVVLGLFASQLVKAPSIVAVDKDGRTLAEITSIRRKGDLLAMKGQLLGSMPATIYLTPEELWKIVGLIDPGVAFALPRLLARGWWRSRQHTTAEGSAPGGEAVGH